MKEPMTPVEQLRALEEAFIGPPTEAVAAEADTPVRKPGKKKLITTLALTSETCRWPLGDPAEPDFHYCGERPLAGQVYCDKHDAQSYHGARRKKIA
jgi:hypothetical protein